MTGNRKFERLKWLMLSGALITLSACATTVPPQGPGQEPVVQSPEPQESVETDPTENETVTENTGETETETESEASNLIKRDGITPPHMAGRDIKRMAILLPFSSRSTRLREEAASMFQAAELAVFNREDADVVLMALDTGGTEAGAASATDAALNAGVDVILGPVLSRSVSGVSDKAREKNVPVIAFSTDQGVAGDGTYLLSFPPEAEVKRIVDYAASTGALRYAYLGPESEYGRRVLAAYKSAVKDNEGELRGEASYDGDDISVMQEPARNLALAYKQHDRSASATSRQHFEAIILPEGGVPLRSLAPLLPYYDIDPERVQFLGTSLWHKDEVVREPALNGGIFAAPDKMAQQNFLDLYDRQYGEEPSRLASLAYDAVNIGAVVADGTVETRQDRVEDPRGFYGADGMIRWTEDGKPDRGLAIYQIQNGRFVIIEPAPTLTTDPS